MNLLNKFQLKDKLLILGVLPAAILAIILAAYLTSTRLNDMYDLLHKTNENLANSIAESSVNGVFSGDVDALNIVIRSAINEPDIISIKIANKIGATLSQATSNISTPELISKPDKKIIQDIQLKSFSQNDDFDGLLVGQPMLANETIGYVTLTLSYITIQQRQQDILFNTSLITLLLLIAIGSIAKYISTTIGRPILQLTKDVNNITQGNYIPPATATANKDEIAILSTEIHAMAHKISSHQHVLEKKVLEATQELRLQNDKLFSAQEEIIKSADAKSQFISHISHEIRTPLNGIIGFLEIIQKTKLDDEQSKLVNASHLSSKNLNAIINEVLDFAQLEAGKVIINKTDFQLKKAIQDALLLLSPQAENNDVILDFQHGSNIPSSINQDYVKFGQILMNLVGNAIKFSPNSTVTVVLNVSSVIKDQLEIRIIDQGIGISSENIKQLFKEYSQLDDLTSAQGTGLGLVITKRIINALHGKINVESTLGVGTTFTFTLPYLNVKDGYSPIKKPALAEQTYPDLTSIKILVADDNEINRLLLSNLLERQHADVTCVNDGQQAIDMAAKQPFDLMLLDLRMPLKMGNEALYEIRHQPSNPNYKTPAIAITAHITSGEEKAHHISSFDGYLIKPIDQVRFFSLVEQLLHEHDFESKPFTSAKRKNNDALTNKSFEYDLAKTSMNADHSFMLIMLERFFAELSKQNDSIAQLIEQDKLIDAADVTHKVHGSAAYCGTPLLKILSKQLDVALRENNLESIPTTHKKFSLEIKTLLSLKSNILSSLKKPLENQEA